MKILELRFKNLNSLYGEWIIDFTDPEYMSNGIFALTGPTGAGKSTILDAVCLALYGRTPRLGRITKSGNEIMSRQTGECYAEVLFESRAGRFRCHWEQRRARKAAEGKLQDQEHQIADGFTGKPIETKKSLVGGVIEEKTGMDYDRFTRSILLAQGGFDTFLKAEIEQKSMILEQITGTEIYSDISKRVHERQRDEREKLTLLKAETSGIVILEPEQEKEIRKVLEDKRIREAEFNKKLTETGKAITWLRTIENLKKEILSLADEAVILQAEREAFKPERDRLEKAVKAASLDEIYATLKALRKQQSDDQTALKTERETLPEKEEAAKTQAERLKSAEQHRVKAKEDLNAAAPLIQKIRSLDQGIAEKEKAVAESLEICARETVKIKTEKQALEKEKEKHTRAEKSLRGAEQYLKENARDEWLISGLAGIEAEFSNLLAKGREIGTKETDFQKAEKSMEEASKTLDAAAKQCVARTEELEKAAKRLQEGRTILKELLKGKILREYRAKKESLLREIAYIQKIMELEDHRSKLADGKPCPLCGAIEHPYAKGNIPEPDEIEQKIEALTGLISRAEEQETLIRKREQEEIDARNNLNNSEKLEANAVSEKKAAEKVLSEARESLAKLRTGFDENKQVVLEKLQPLGIREIGESEISSLLASLKTRLNAWQEQDTRKSEIEKQISDINSEIKSLNSKVEIQITSLTEKQETLERLGKEHAAGTEERKNLYGDKKPDDEENRLNKAFAEAEEAEKDVRRINSERLQILTVARTHVETLKKGIEQREPDLKNTEKEFLAGLASTGFPDEKLFLEARMANEERESLSSRAKELDDAQTDLNARQKDRKSKLADENTRKITEKTLELLEPQFKEYEESLNELRDLIAASRHKLNENTAAKERIKEKQSAIVAQTTECHRWEKLHGLIGSADGKKYRNFAQGLTFELMVSHANRQLEKMTDRYLLIRDDEEPLELNVVDNYQAGEIRSIRNLSGGESFIISLTLALGLSKMASKKVRVDSLFLDEGFGSLDEESLETALETLSGLQQDGKLIGIISHVAALKERISTQISINPISGGRSSLMGPGCGSV